MPTSAAAASLAFARQAEHPQPRAIELDDATPQELLAAGSAVSWAAILAGAAAAAALSLILLLLGTGLGLSSASPWTNQGAQASTLGVAGILWITLTQVAASGMGGYLAGRLRARWVSVHTDEVYFRDTAHGFLAWAIATLVSAAVLTTAISSLLGGTVRAGLAVADSAMAAASEVARTDAAQGGMDYFVDAMLRKVAAPVGASSTASQTAGGVVSTSPNDGVAGPAANQEIARIFSHAMVAGALPDEDLRYLGQLVAQRTGLSQAQAQSRVSALFAQAQTALRDAQTAAKASADAARKAAAYTALWFFITLLVGAFSASLAATLGGRQRDA